MPLLCFILSCSIWTGFHRRCKTGGRSASVLGMCSHLPAVESCSFFLRLQWPHEPLHSFNREACRELGLRAFLPNYPCLKTLQEFWRIWVREGRADNFVVHKGQAGCKDTYCHCEGLSVKAYNLGTGLHSGSEEGQLCRPGGQGLYSRPT